MISKASARPVPRWNPPYAPSIPWKWKQGENDLVIRVCGNGFLYNMVRIIAGTLLDIGQGKRDPMDIFTILEAKDRSAAGPTAPAHGLTLMKYEFL